jgi:hypothetical protein
MFKKTGFLVFAVLCAGWVGAEAPRSDRMLLNLDEVCLSTCLGN